MSGAIHWTFLPSLVPIGVMVSEKKIKMQKFTEVMAILYMTIWAKWANKVLSDITFVSKSWRKNLFFNRCKESRWPSCAIAHTWWSHAWWVFNQLHLILFKIRFHLPLVPRVGVRRGLTCGIVYGLSSSKSGSDCDTHFFLLHVYAVCVETW